MNNQAKKYEEIHGWLTFPKNQTIDDAIEGIRDKGTNAVAHEFLNAVMAGSWPAKIAPTHDEVVILIEQFIAKHH